MRGCGWRPEDGLTEYASHPMNWFSMLWPMAAAASLTLALVHFGVWLGKRDERANLLFSVAATATAVVALMEFMVARAETTAQYATLVRWTLAPLWFLVVSLILFVREFFGTGRAWLALCSIGLWTLTVIVNFLPGQNLVYEAMTGLRSVEIFGAGNFVVGEGVPNPWNAVNYLGTLLMLVFVVDASIALWRQGGRRRALVVGGGVVFFFLVAGVHSALIEAGLIQSPYIISFSFLAIVVTMSSELSGDLLRAAKTSRQLQQSEVSLRESEERLQLATDAAGAGLWSLDLDTRHVWANPQMLNLFQFAASPELTFESFLRAIHPEDRDAAQQAVQRALETDAALLVEFRVALPDGSMRWISARGQRRCKSSGEPGRLMGAAIDITERKHTEAEALRHFQAFAHLSRVSTMGELTTSLAHELNQPLGAILRNAESAEILLQADAPDLDELRAIVTDIRKDDERAGNVIDRLRALLSQRSLALMPIGLSPLVDEVVLLVRFDAISRHVQLETDIPADLPPVQADRVHLQQVLLNLITNSMDAMTDGQNGDRRVGIRARPAGERMIEVAVTDSGPGIPPEAINGVFEPFFTTKASGMGMGLPISRTIIEAHEGRIWAENNATRGATFYFTLTTAAGGAV